jgi:hypothetical protein
MAVLLAGMVKPIANTRIPGQEVLYASAHYASLTVFVHCCQQKLAEKFR